MHPRGLLGLLAFAVVVSAVLTVDRDLHGNDEPRFAGIAREMVLRGDWVVPRLNGLPFLDYPALGYWPTALAISLRAEPGDALAQLPTALCAIAAVWLTHAFGMLLGGRSVGLASGFALCIMVGFVGSAWRPLVDPPLLVLILLALYGFLRGARGDGFRWFALAYLSVAAGVLCKGLIGVAIPVAVAGSYYLLSRDWGLAWRMRPFAGLAVFLLPLLLFGLATRHAGGGELLRGMFDQSVMRFGAETEHSQPLTFYLLPLLYLLLPWTCLPPLWFWLRGRGIALVYDRGAAFFPLVWFGAVLLGLSLSSAKRQLYLLPLLPAAALLAGIGWAALRQRVDLARRCEPLVLCGFLAVLLAVRVFLLHPLEQEESYRPIFERVAAERGERQVILYRVSLAAAGAAVFYLGETVPQSGNPDRLREHLSHGGGSLLLTRETGRAGGAAEIIPGSCLRAVSEASPSSRVVLRLYEIAPGDYQSGRGCDGPELAASLAALEGDRVAVHRSGRARLF